MKHFLELGHPVFDLSAIKNISDPALRTAVGKFNQRFREPVIRVRSMRTTELSNAFEVKRGDLVSVVREARRFGIVEAVLCEYEYPWRKVAALSFDTWRLNALFALVWVGRRDLEDIWQLTT